MSIIIRDQDGQWQIQTASVVHAWQTPDEWQSGQPLLLTVDAEPDAGFKAASAIAIDFPAFTDGRGLSLAVLLHTRVGFSGELRAMGAIHEDVLHYMVRCGFDALELPSDRDIGTALTLLSPYSGLYQNSVSNAGPIQSGPTPLQRWA